MIEIEDKIVSIDLFTQQFCCDIAACRGACCVEGDSGAPLLAEEAHVLQAEYTNFVDYMTPQGVRSIDALGYSVIDEDGDLTTPLIGDRGECAYSISTESGTWCAIEKAWREGRTTFRKPISCHLYPIRVKEFSNGTFGLQYHRWGVCRPAVLLGRSKGEPLFRTMREPIVRRFGEPFYELLEQAYNLVK